jgi:hypothetical protein
MVNLMLVDLVVLVLLKEINLQFITVEVAYMTIMIDLVPTLMIEIIIEKLLIGAVKNSENQ